MSTLGELLAEDGFERERDKLKLLQTEDSAASIAASFPNPRHGFSGSRPRPARTRSDFNPRRSLPMMPEPRAGNALERWFSSMSSYKNQSPEVRERESRFLRYSKEPKESERSSNENRLRLYSTEEADVNKDGSFEDFQRKLRYNRCYNNELYVDEERKGKRIQNLLKPGFKDVRDECSVPALDETTLEAVFLIINGCISDLLEDECFRSSVNQSCISSLKSSGMKDIQLSDNGVVSTLKEAIGTVERIVSEGFTKLELKKTALKLSVITGVKSMESVDRYFCGISPSHLVACAHLYLSILCKIQKKDAVSAKHLLQVFFHSPYQARTALLPELWESLFLPHLSHLKAWHDKEVESIQGTSGIKRKLELLNKLYDDLLDMGTSKFAAFYKGWLMEDSKSPEFPSVLIPFASFPDIPEDDYQIVSTKSSSSSYSVSSKAVISKTPYEYVLAKTKRIQTADGMESGEEEKSEAAFGGPVRAWLRLKKQQPRAGGKEPKSRKSGFSPVLRRGMGKTGGRSGVPDAPFRGGRGFGAAPGC